MWHSMYGQILSSHSRDQGCIKKQVMFVKHDMKQVFHKASSVFLVNYHITIASWSSLTVLCVR
jgi:ABC-type Mn2+/Zn2+ transport system ATPase subunit